MFHPVDTIAKRLMSNKSKASGLTALYRVNGLTETSHDR